MIIHNCEQGSEEWFKIRLGIPSASCFDKIITSTGAPSKQAEKYMYQLAGEAVSGQIEQTYQNAAMLRGKELEGEAREFYELLYGVTVEQVGFCTTETDPLCGCSPDGLIGDDGGLEIKCPTLVTHVGYLLNDEFPMDYFHQVQGNLCVTDRKWWDFISYFPGMKPLIKRVERCEKYISSLKTELTKFCKNLEEIKLKLK